MAVNEVGQEQLKGTKCEDPDCKEKSHTLVLASRCHPGVPMFATYDPEDPSRMVMRCAECDGFVVSVKVAP